MTNQGDNPTYVGAMQHSEAAEFVAAMQAEIMILICMNVFEIIQGHSKQNNIKPNIMLMYLIEQCEGINYFETINPVIRHKPCSFAYGLVNGNIIHLSKLGHTLLGQVESILYNFVAVAWNGSQTESILTGEIRTQKLETEAYNQELNQYGGTSKIEAI